MFHPINVLSLPVGQMQANCYIIYRENSKEALIIDPGDDADFIERKIADLNLTPIGICATHGHFDHTMAVTEIKLAYRIPFYISQKDMFLLENMQSLVKHHLHIDSDPFSYPDVFYTEKTIIKGGDMEIHILETPGHTPGSISLYPVDEKMLFVGDLIFKGGSTGRTDFSYSNPHDLYNSLKKIFKMPDKTVVYPGHGDKTILEKTILEYERNFY